MAEVKITSEFEDQDSYGWPLDSQGPRTYPVPYSGQYFPPPHTSLFSRLFLDTLLYLPPLNQV
ncbi:hypothetical protein K449DRAFT_390946 [Hypoxylon sp. EC38]|nr:hypothetical protein K449DRAFT_390946 [Hypoxylon sp. EC38]